MPNNIEQLGSVRRIAVVRALFLGDLLLAIPALRALRAGFPKAEITYVGLPWAEAFVRRFPRYVDRFVEFAGYPGIIEVPVDPDRTARFLAEQQGYGYDVVVQMHGSGQSSNPLAAALGGRITVGHYLGAPPTELTVGAPYPNDAHEVYRNLNLARLLGCSSEDTRLEFPLLPEDRIEAARLLPRAGAHRLTVGLHAGASAPSRRWPPAYFARVGDYFVQRYGAQIILTGGPGETGVAAEVAQHMTSQPIDFSGKTSLGGLAAILASLDLFLTNDTGPAHMAYALNTPSVTLFGPIDHRRWEPLDQRIHIGLRRPVECSPCELRECPIDHRCLRWLTPATVITGLEGLLKREKAA